MAPDWLPTVVKLDSTTKTNEKRIAIALSGDPRGFKQTHQSLYHNLVLCNPAVAFEGFVVFGFKGRPFRPYTGGVVPESDYLQQSEEIWKCTDRT